jgi:hypothetical protein
MRWSILVRGCCLTLRVRLPVLCGACVRLLPLSFGQPHAEPSRVRLEQLPELSCWAARAGAFGAQMPPTITAAARWLSSGRSFVCAFVCACLSSSSLPAALFNTWSTGGVQAPVVAAGALERGLQLRRPANPVRLQRCAADHRGKGRVAAPDAWGAPRGGAVDRRARLDVRRIGGRLDQRALARGEVRGGGRRAGLAKSGHGGKQGPSP